MRRALVAIDAYYYPAYSAATTYVNVCRIIVDVVLHQKEDALTAYKACKRYFGPMMKFVSAKMVEDEPRIVIQ